PAPPKPAAPEPDDGRLRVLIVDDHAPTRRLLSTIAIAMDCQATEACDGSEALEALLLDPYDLVLMDLQMPVMDGREAVRRIRASKRLSRTPVVAVTSLAGPGVREDLLKAGFTDYLPKPVDPAAINRLVMAHSRRSRAR
ncbi:MAG: response regulator, partial [Alphaproteobacteria bacterium]|nr:response regulator [Alphaproteobacteria bacterium]